MSNNLKAGLALIAAVCAGGIYAGYKKFTSQKLTLQLVLTILKEIKFQTFNGCLLFAEGVKRNVLSRMPNDQAKREQIKSRIKDEVLAVYEQKQHLILLKYGVDKEEFESMVVKHEKQLKQLEEEIENLMLDAIVGKLPDLQVPETIKKQFPLEKLFALYRDMLLTMIEIMVRTFKRELENPEFNLSDQDDYLRVIRSIHVYQLKEKFFTERGFVCEDQNLTFAKIMEQYKRKDPEFADKSKQLEKAYEGYIHSLSSKVEELDFARIKPIFEKVRHSKEDKQEEGDDLPEPPAMSWQASSTTQNLANWVHADQQLINEISGAIKKGKVAGHNAVLTSSQAEEMLGADNIRHDFSKKQAVEEVRPAEPVVQKLVVPEPEPEKLNAPVASEPVPPTELPEVPKVEPVAEVPAELVAEVPAEPAAPVAPVADPIDEAQPAAVDAEPAEA